MSKPGWLAKSLERAVIEAGAMRLAKNDPAGVIEAYKAWQDAGGHFRPSQSKS